MLFEYALDPSLLTTWPNCRFFVETFGRSQGRLISRFPSKWKRLVYEGLGNCHEIEKKKIVEKLATIDSRLLARQHDWSPQQTWLANAETEHQVRPFRAIVASSNPRTSPFVVEGTDVGDHHPLWHSPVSLTVSRTAAAMCQALSPMLDCCTEVVFVDPHFGPEKSRHRRPFAAFMDVLGSGGRCRQLKSVAFHLSAKSTVDFFQGKCTAELPRLIPAGMSVRFVRWRPEDMHNRYVLTDVGGILIGQGLDDGDGDAKLLDDFSRLDDAAWHERWADFVSKPKFTKIDEFVVAGMKPGQATTSR